MSTKLDNCERCIVGFGTRGLMFRKKLDRPLVFILKREDIIFLHTFFVRFTIDVLLLDTNKKVIKKITMKPWRFFVGRARYIIEWKKDLFKNVSIGDILEF